MIDLRLGCCLEVLPALVAGSIGHVVTDPPYGQTNEAYDSPIAFRPDVWRECYRVTGDNAALLAFAGSPTYHRIASAIEAAGWKVRQMWAWVYRDGLITSAWPKEGFDRLAPAMDPIVFATKGKVLLNVEREGKPWKVWHERKPGDCPLSSRSDTLHAATEGNGHYPRTVVSDGSNGFEYFDCRRTRPDRDSTSHPNQKPLALIRWLVDKLPPGSVLDTFAGSATTAVACFHAGLDCVAVEKNPEYVAIARRRIEAAQQATPLFA